MKEYICLFALLFESRRPSLYEQQRDTFIDQMITKIWAFQQRVFDLGDPSDWKTIVEQNREYIVEENCFAQELND